MYVFHGSQESPDDDSWEKLGKALVDPKRAWQVPGVVDISKGKPDPALVRGLVSKGAADWLIVEDDDGVPVEVIVNADIVHTPWFQRHQDMLRGHNLKLISLAPGAPGIIPDLLSPRKPGLEPVPLVRPEGADPKPTAQVPSDPPKPPGETGSPAHESTTTPAPPAAATVPKPVARQPAEKEAPTPTPATSSDPHKPGAAEVIGELAKARRPIPALRDTWVDRSADLPERVADAHLAEQAALNAAMVWQASPESMWLALVAEQDRAALAAEILLAERVWPASPDTQLLNSVTDPQQRSDLAKQLLLAKAGLPASATMQTRQEELEEQRVKFEEQRVKYFEQAVAQAAEYVQQRQKWRTLADYVPKILIGTLLASVVLTIGVLYLVSTGAMDGWQAVMVIFVLAVAAVSPAVLLLVERPLAGIDAFQPNATKPGSGGAAGSEGSKPAGADGAGSAEDRAETSKA